jgi:drug/metabolite transporter (DMT)-like permease
MVQNAPFCACPQFGAQKCYYMLMKQQTRAYLRALTAVLLWSTVASAFKLTLRRLDYLEMLLYSSGVSTAALFAVLLGRKKLTLLRASTARDLFRSALLGALNPFVYYIVLFKAYSLLPAQQAQPLNYTWPVTLTLLSIPLLGQRIGLRSIAAVLVSFAGVVVISTRGDLRSFTLTSPLGVGLAVGSSVIWALYWIYSLRDGRDETVKLFLSFLFGFAFILVTMLARSGLRPPPLDGLAGAVYVGLFEMGLTFLLWLAALRLSRTTAQVSILIYLSPFISLVLIRFLVGERILASTVVGLVFIVAGILIQKVRSPS